MVTTPAPPIAPAAAGGGSGGWSGGGGGPPSSMYPAAATAGQPSVPPPNYSAPAPQLGPGGVPSYPTYAMNAPAQYAQQAYRPSYGAPPPAPQPQNQQQQGGPAVSVPLAGPNTGTMPPGAPQPGGHPYPPHYPPHQYQQYPPHSHPHPPHSQPAAPGAYSPYAPIPSGVNGALSSQPGGHNSGPAPGMPPPGAPGVLPPPPGTPTKPDHIAVLAELGGALQLADIDVQWSNPRHFRLGKGGMGEVWAGKWRKHTDVAIKVVGAEFIGNKTEQRQMFMREMKINRDLRHHPNVVQFIGVAYDDQSDRYLLITELCRFKSLSEVLREPSLRPRLTWPVRKRMMREAALGVDYLHSERIVHMDIKPLNFLVTEYLQVKVGDFGLAKQLTMSRMQTSIQGYAYLFFFFFYPPLS
jgi:hypothetical protein